jgi:hypothetical protein
VLAGLVERVTYHNAENGFCVLQTKARGHRDVVTVVGHAATIAAGEWINRLIYLGLRALLLPQCFHGRDGNISAESKRPLTF